MKCHDILGVKEKSTISDIENAYSIKLNILSECRAELSDNAYALKSEELLTAYDECLEWYNKSASEKIRSKLMQKDMNHSKQVRLYDIGFCSACGSECEHECGCIDGCGCEGCGTAVDVMVYIAIGAGALYGLGKIISKIHQSNAEAKAEEERSNRQRLYNQALNENQSLEQEQRTIRDRIDHEQSELKNLEKQYTEIISFAKFFEALGSNDTTRLQQNISNQLHTKMQSIASMQRRETEIREKINANDEIIRRGP